MKSNANPDPAAPTSQASAPSVPISVYRELAAELQATRVMLESLHSQNQHLAQQNQQLRQEVVRVVQLGQNLRHWVEVPQSTDAVANNPSPQPSSDPAFEASAVASAIAAKLRANELSQTEFTEAAPLPLHLSEDKSARFSGLWLTLTILFIVLTAFGAGFLVMKPFLSGNR